MEYLFRVDQLLFHSIVYREGMTCPQPLDFLLSCDYFDLHATSRVKLNPLNLLERHHMCLAPSGLLIKVQVLPLLPAVFPATSDRAASLCPSAQGARYLSVWSTLITFFEESQTSNRVNAVYLWSLIKENIHPPRKTQTKIMPGDCSRAVVG